MKIDQISSDGLKQSYKVLIEASEIDKKVKTELASLKDKVAIKGFRPGKTPMSLLEKTHGKAVRGQLLERMVNESIEKLYNDNKIQPATTPNVEILKFEEKSDLEFKLEVEVVPEIKTPEISRLKLERLVAKPDPGAVKSRMEALLEQNKQFADAPEGAAARKGDTVVIDFKGTIGGKPVEGAEAEGHALELGSGAFIPGFEEQLLGAKKGDRKTVKVTFPKDYQVDDVAGKEVTFEVTVRNLRTPKAAKLDDGFAKSLGFADLKALKDHVARQLDAENAAVSRQVVKRRLLDVLSDQVRFKVPEGMIEREYQQIWERLKNEMMMAGEATAEELEKKDGPDDPRERKEFRAIAERRVRLGLLLAEIGRKHEVSVSQDEINQQVIAEAQRYPGREREILDFYKKNPQAMEAIRAPVFEEKVIDLILEKAAVKDKPVTPEELRKEQARLEEYEGPVGEEGKSAKAKPAAKKSAKKPARKSAKKAAPKAGKRGAKKPAAGNKPAKKK